MSRVLQRIDFRRQVDRVRSVIRDGIHRLAREVPRRSAPTDKIWQIRTMEARTPQVRFDVGDEVSVKFRRAGHKGCRSQPRRSLGPDDPSGIVKGWTPSRINRGARSLSWREGRVAVVIPPGANASAYIRWRLKVPSTRLHRDVELGSTLRYGVDTARGKVIAPAFALRRYESAMHAWYGLIATMVDVVEKQKQEAEDVGRE
jgi:hypothetical protein